MYTGMNQDTVNFYWGKQFYPDLWQLTIQNIYLPGKLDFIQNNLNII
jgi:hypothetical protein